MWQKLGFLSESFMESLWHFVAGKIIELNRPRLKILVLFWPVYCSMEKLWIDTLWWQSMIAWLQFDEKIDTQRNRNKCKLDNFLKFDDSDTNVGWRLIQFLNSKLAFARLNHPKSKKKKCLELIKVDLKSEKFFLNIVNCRCRLVPGDVCMSKVGLGLNKI